MTIGGREAGIRSSPCSATIDADVEAASVSDRINHHRGLGVSPRRKIGGRRRANTDNRTDGNNGKGSILNFSRCPLQHFGASDESAFAVAIQRRALARFSNCCIMACRREARARPVAQVATATPAFLPTPANDFHSHSSQPPSETIDFGGVLTKPPDACIIHTWMTPCGNAVAGHRLSPRVAHPQQSWLSQRADMRGNRDPRPQCLDYSAAWANA